MWNDDGDSGRPFVVVVDGRTLTWEELGVALERYEGWRLRLVIGDSIDDARSDAVIVEVPRPERGAEPAGE